MEITLRRLFIGTTLVVSSLLAVTAQAEMAAADVAALEARIAQLEADSRTAAGGRAQVQDRIRINGFMSAGFGRADIDDMSYDGLGERMSHRMDSVLGLQVDARVGSDTHAVTQLVARGGDRFNVNAEWAYIGYRPADNDEVRIGRQRYPFFVMSEYLEVGYAYPWAKPSLEVYLPAIPSAYDGISWRRSIGDGDFRQDVQVYWGSSDFPVSGGALRLDNSAGIGWQGSAGDWQFNANYSQAAVTMESAFFDGLATAGIVQPLDRDRGWFAGVGLQYDNGKLLLLSEATQVSVPGYFPDTAEEYITLGYRIGKVMPHVTYASARITDHSDRPADPTFAALCPGPGGPLCLDSAAGVPFPANALALALENAQDTLTLGMRYDFASNAALKVDWTHVLDTHNTFGMFVRDDGNVFYGAKPGDDVNIYRVVVDVVF